MKKTTLLTFLFTVLNFTIYAQNFDLAQLDQVVLMVSQGNQKSSAKFFDQALTGMDAEVEKSQSAFVPKIKNQISIASALLPSLLKENTELGTLKKMVSSLKTLMAAHRLHQMVNETTLIGKEELLVENLSLLKLGISANTTSADAAKINKVNSLFDKISSKIVKLDTDNSKGKSASKMIKKKLDVSLALVKDLI